MASAALTKWQTVRTPALTAVESVCTAAAPPLAGELLRGYVMLLSGHFQGCCRDLYSECAQAVVRASPAGLRFLVQRQCETSALLDTRNPTFETIAADFGRFGLNLSGWAQPGGANQGWVTQLNLLNRWRNYAAHANPLPPTHPAALTVAVVGGWRATCDAVTAELDRELYNLLTAAAGGPPW